MVVDFLCNLLYTACATMLSSFDTRKRFRFHHPAVRHLFHVLTLSHQTALAEKEGSMQKFRINWHEAAVSAIQIDLRDYSHILEYHSEYTLSHNHNRIDLLVIQKNTQQPIPKSIASIFLSFNLFEIKGIHSTITTDAYYKLNGHASYLIDSIGVLNQYNRHDISLSFLSFRKPCKLFRHLTKDCGKSIANPFPGIYYISNEMYITQVIVVNELSPDDSLYLSCLTDNLTDSQQINRLVADYTQHQDNEIYNKYMNQLSRANTKKGDSPMVCEGILNLCGTSSKEIEDRAKEQTKAIYIPQIQQLTAKNHELKEKNDSLTTEKNRLQELLTLNNIAY